MSNDPRETGGPPGDNAPARVPGELFCIHSYAGESGPRCGWRGAADEMWRCAATGTRRCPRCGRTTLLEIPRPSGAGA